MIDCRHHEDSLDAAQIIHKAAHAMKLSDSIFNDGTGHENIERCRDFSEKPIYVGGWNTDASIAVIRVVADMEEAINRRLRECGVRIEINAQWVNIADERVNPVGNFGRVIVDFAREKQVS